MELPDGFVPFAEGASCAVLTRMVAEWTLDREFLSLLFQQHAVTQYDREITLDQLVMVMLDVACGICPSVRAGFGKWKDQINASLSAFYTKLERMDPELGMALVAQTADRLRPLLQRLIPEGQEPVLGFRSYLLDGNMLAGTEHRLKPLRRTRAAALPGKSLVLYECATRLVAQTVLWEDAYSQERALLPKLKIPSGIHLIADRNFCVLWFLEAIQQAGSYFTIRHHQQFTIPEETSERRVGRCETGVVYERRWKHHDDAEQAMPWRAIRVELDEPTRDGDTEIQLLTNLPLTVAAREIADAYRHRWTIEGHFQRLTEHVHRDIPSLGQPRAALFAFAMSLVAGNMLAVVIAALEAAHGKDLADNVSYYYLVDEVAGNYRGMLLALPAPRWRFVRQLSAQNFSTLLRQVARFADSQLLRKTKRGPKKKRRTPNCTNVRHLSTKRLLDKHR